MTSIPTGQWANAQVGLPSQVTDLVSAIDNLIEALVSILNISKTILDIVRTFMIGELDAVTAIIEEIIAEIEGYITDIAELGIYVSGDFVLRWPLDDLRGGYTTYEARMVSRFLNRADPTRPNFSSSEYAVAIFLYQSVDESAIQALVNAMGKLAQLFGKKDVKPRVLPTPVPGDVLYGTLTSALGQWGTTADILGLGDTPTVANVRWKLAPPANAGSVAWPLLPPAGFLIEVSTLKDGLVLAWDGPSANATADENGTQQRQFGLVSGPDLKPFRLYGGVGSFVEGDDLKWHNNGSTYFPTSVDSNGEMKPGGLRTYGYTSSADSTPVPLSSLYQNGKYLLQRSFYYDATPFIGNKVAPGQSFSFKLDYDDMPYEATFEDAGNGGVKVTVDTAPARDVYVRITAVTKEVEPTGGEPLATSFAWTLTGPDVIRGQQNGVVALGATQDAGNLGPSSVPMHVTFPSGTAGAVADTFATALAVLVLSRSDLAVSEDGSFKLDTAKMATGLEPFAFLVSRVFDTTTPSKYFKKDDILPPTFRRFILQRCRIVANQILVQMGALSDSLYQTILDASTVDVAGGKPLYKVTWRDLDPAGPDLTILESLDSDTPGGALLPSGVALNPLSIGLVSNSKILVLMSQPYVEGLTGIALHRNPSFSTKGTSDVGFVGRGSADYSPVLYDFEALPVKMDFCRNVFQAQPTIFTATQSVLGPWTSPLNQQVTASNNGSWEAIRFISQGLPDLQGFLDQLTQFLGVVQQGVQQTTDSIIKYIEFVETRILELEALLQRIEALLAYLVSIEIPSMSGLVVTGAGTDGLVQEFISAENKPSDSSSAYGAGVVIVAGGVPTPIIDLLLLFFQQAEGA
jgi:hypothetical protein